MAKLFRTDGTAMDITPKNGTDFQLDELYEALDCELVEVIRIPWAGKIVVIDEEGKFSGKGVNEEITHYLRYHSAIASYDYIIGDAIICGTEELR